jgi:prolyl oligopeptidase
MRGRNSSLHVLCCTCAAIFECGVICSPSFACSSPQVAASASAANDLRWLEPAKDEKALAWVRAQNERTITYLRRHANYDQNHAQALAAVLDGRGGFDDVGISGGFVYEIHRTSATPRGVLRRAPAETYFTGAPVWDDLLDVDALAAKTKSKILIGVPNLFSFSPNGSRVLLYETIEGSSGELRVREFDLATRSFTEDGFDIGWTKGSIPTWLNDDTLLVQHNFPDGHFETVSVKRGQAPTDAVLFWRGSGPGAIAVYALPGTPSTVLISERGGDASRLWLRQPGGVTTGAAGAPPGATLLGITDAKLVFLLGQDWSVRGRLLAKGSLISMDAGELSNRTPNVQTVMRLDADEALTDAWSVKGGLLATGAKNAESVLWSLRWDGSAWKRRQLALPRFGTISGDIRDPGSATGYIGFESATQPRKLYSVDVVSGRIVELTHPTAGFDTNGIVTEQHFTRSADSTLIPYILVRHRGHPKRNTPTLLEGYGAYGLLNTPGYSSTRGRLWLAKGGAYVIANTRGGGEFGPKWYVTKADRRRVYEDFAAVASDLIRRGYTSPRRLGIIGHSAGGSLVAVALNQHPSLFHAAVLENPFVDFLRPDLTGPGPGRSSLEWGSLDRPRELALLEQTSPTENLRPGIADIRPLVLSATDDRQVFPAQPRRYVATMQQHKIPSFYFENDSGGHGMADTVEGHARVDTIIFTYLQMRLFGDDRDK